MALSDVGVDVVAGRVHALVGENGAGKSTLLGLLSGRLVADGGQLRVFGHELPAGRPREIRELGISAIYQELTMVPALSAVANVFLGQSLRRGPMLSEREMRRRFTDLCRQFEVSIRSDLPVRELSVSQQQVLEIMRGVQADARVLLLDEPTAALAEHERGSLYRILQQLKRAGTTIIFVSHNLQEVLSLSDDISVLRDGQLVRTAPTRDWDRKSIIRAMVGRDVEVDVGRQHAPGDDVLLECQEVFTGRSAHPLSLTVRRGEVVGLWGLVGSGRTRFLRSLAGLEPQSRGRLYLDGVELDWPHTVRQALGYGIAMLPEDRKNGLVLGMTGQDNVHLGAAGDRKAGFIHPRKERDAAARSVERFTLRAARLREPVGRLSGGNQQKVLFAKWAFRQPRVLLVDEPTRGIDVKAKSEVLTAISNMAKSGVAVLVTSSELEEVLAVSDRLLAFAHGQIVREIAANDAAFNANEIVRLGFTQPGHEHDD